MNTDDIIRTMKEEGEGSRGVFYENYGSGINPVLVPLAELLDATKDTYPELVERVASSFYTMR